MNYELKKVADNIIDAAIKAVLPDKAVIRALENKEFPGRVILVSVGKAAWQMANAASEYLGDRIDKGIVITKYGHVKGEIENVTCFEAGHPVPDDNSFKATRWSGCFCSPAEEVHCLKNHRFQVMSSQT